MEKEKSNASLTILDISRGYSVLKVKGKTLFFKHPSNVHYLNSEEYYFNRLEAATKKGIKTEDKLLEMYIKRGVWSKKKEEKLASLVWTIDKTQNALSKITDNNQKAAIQNGIKSQAQELKVLRDERNKLVGQSAENWASQQRLMKMAKDHIFEDENCSITFDFKDDLVVIVALQKRMNKLYDRNTLLRAVYEPSFFDVFSLQYRDPLSVFGVTFFSITVFQRHLLSHASVILNKLKNLEIPDEIKDDPVKVYEFKPNTENEGKKVTHGVEDLKASMKQKGKLTPEDLLK